MDNLLKKLFKIIEKNDNKSVLLYGNGVIHMEDEQLRFIENQLIKFSGSNVWCLSAKQLYNVMVKDIENGKTGVRHEYFHGKIIFIDGLDQFAFTIEETQDTVNQVHLACQVNLILLLFLLKKQEKIVIATCKKISSQEELEIMKILNNYFEDVIYL